MEAIVERCCGLDVRQAGVVACVLTGIAGRKPRKETRTFGTMARDLEALRDWLAAERGTHVGMESTGVSWTPVRAALEGGSALIVGNARHKPTRPSFVPPPEMRATCCGTGARSSGRRRASATARSSS